MVSQHKQGGKYRIERRIGVGGMAEVYLATSTGPAGFERRVVLKKILPHLASNERFVRYFIDEAKTAAALDHENVVRIFDFFAEDEELVLVMEYVEGTDLAQLMNLAFAAGQKMPLHIILFVGRKILKGLAYAHDRTDPRGNRLGIVHRDVTPRNVLIGANGEVKVADFGIARSKSLRGATMTGELKGKISYMSPEQARGEEVDLRSDLYSAALLIWELIAGCRAFDAVSEIDLLEKVKHPQLPDIDSLRSGVPVELKDALTRALSPHKEDRYADAGSFERRLARIASDIGMEHDESLLAEYVRQMMDSELAADLAKRQTLTFIGREQSGVITPPGEVRPRARPKKKTRKRNIAIGIAAILTGLALILIAWGSDYRKDDNTAPPTFLGRAEAALLSVQTEPAGAMVLYNGQPLGITPIKALPVIPDKRIILQAIKLGYLPQKKRINLIAQKHRTISFELPASNARSISITSD